MATLATASGGATAIDILLGLLVVAVIVSLVIVYSRRKGFGGAASDNVRAASPGRGNVAFMIEPEQLDALLASAGEMLAAGGFIPQGSTPGLYAYQKNRRPSIIIAVLLLLLWIIPGLIYLFLGGRKEVVTVRTGRLSEIEFPITGAVWLSEIPPVFLVNVRAPAGTRRQILSALEPYAVDLDYLVAHPGQIFVGRSLGKKQMIDCEHCGHVQEITIPFVVDRVEGNRGYGSGGSITVTCENPQCGKPFEVDWDNVILDLQFTGGGSNGVRS